MKVGLPIPLTIIERADSERHFLSPRISFQTLFFDYLKVHNKLGYSRNLRPLVRFFG